MKNTLKTLLILSSCLRLVLFTTTTLAGDEDENRDVPSSSYPDIESALDSRKKNKNPLIKINDAKLGRDYTDEECCEALEDYNNLVASCSRSGRGIAHVNFCNIIINRQTVLDAASDEVEEKCRPSRVFDEADYEELFNNACSPGNVLDMRDAILQDIIQRNTRI